MDAVKQGHSRDSEQTSVTLFLSNLVSLSRWHGKEQRRPPSSAFHVNYYQEGVAWPTWDPNFDYGLDGGPMEPPTADPEFDVDNPTPTETHYTVDDDAAVLNGVESRLTPRITR